MSLGDVSVCPHMSRAFWLAQTLVTLRAVAHPPLSMQVEASLEEQNFTELWGKKAKELYGNIWSNFSDTQLKKIIGSIQTLGPSNLPLDKRQQVGDMLAKPWRCLHAAKSSESHFSLSIQDPSAGPSLCFGGMMWSGEVMEGTDGICGSPLEMHVAGISP